MDIDKQPGISFDGILLASENFYRIPSIPDELKIDINFSMELNNFEDSFSNQLTATLVCSSSGGEEALRLECTFIGVFSILKGEENMDIKEFMKQNSAAMMFPYIREHITSITQKSGISPIILPPINIIAMIKDIQDNLN